MALAAAVPLLRFLLHHLWDAFRPELGQDRLTYSYDNGASESGMGVLLNGQVRHSEGPLRDPRPRSTISIPWWYSARESAASHGSQVL
ncbi:hypothetical protein EXIGLDRAFT_724347 [Exidia glandulosa HHB12029]|uniref:Uncharacterized protein n=1 Tax=Exidia glandulosa HHB12029 TaxID=1314781 RepID=A0A165EH39_EXIGL|nr:hypothetical protein EXIGLDRAFT_724347 [Exidia glandulosa HHB12029]